MPGLSCASLGMRPPSLDILSTTSYVIRALRKKSPGTKNRDSARK